MTQNCKKRDKAFGTKGALEEHILSHDETKSSRKRGRPGTVIPCGDCEELFYRRCDLRIHRKVVHQPKKNACGVCGRTFSSAKRLRMHSQFHNNGGEFECFYCMKEFNKGWKLKIHLVNHSGRPPYLCQYCKEDFLYPGKILEHLKREHGIMYACKDCGEAFECFDEQEDHICKLYECKDCSSSFMTVEELAAHAVHHKDGTLSVELPTCQQLPIIPCQVNQEMPSLDSQSSDNLSLQPSVTVNVKSCPQPVVNVSTLNSSFEVNVSSNHPRLEVDVSCVQPSSNVLQANNTSTNLQSKFDNSCFPNKVKIKTLHQFNVLENRQEVNRNGNVIRESDDKDGEVPTTKDAIASNLVDLAYQHNPVAKELAVCTLPSSLHNSGVKNSEGFSFKIPITNWGPPKRPISTVKSTNNMDCIYNLDNKEQMIKVDIGQSSLRNSLDNRENFTGTNKVHQKECPNNSDHVEEQVSLESWLTGETSQLKKRDFVFGLASKGGDDIIDLTYNSTKFSFKKKQNDMTFEDLCQF